MQRIALLLFACCALFARADHGSTVVFPTATTVNHSGPLLYNEGSIAGGLFQSDREFDDFIGPITSPILSKDPRSLSEFRALFIQNWFPDNHPVFGGGDTQIYAGQLRIALSDRLTFIADKDGIASLHPQALPHQNGFLNIAAGLKYTLIRDVEEQRLLALGFQYELPTGEAKVFQNHGAGQWTVFGTYGKEFGDKYHILINEAYSFGQNWRDSSSFFFTQIHLDKQICGWLYPLVEANWYRWVSGGNRGIPAIVGEGDGLINLGTTGVAGNDLVTIAGGLKAVLSPNVQIGVAYEKPVSNRKDILDHRITAELILRY
jgi:hypothetical protein